MNPLEETIVYDAMIAIQRYAPVFCDIANADPKNAVLREAYKSGIYAPVIKLGMALGPEAIARGKARYAELDRKAKEFFAQGPVADGEPA